MSKSELYHVLAVDPSLRNTGLAVITFDPAKEIEDPSAYTVSSCQVLINPVKFTGTDAILNMLDMLQDEAKKSCYAECKDVVIESPGAIFNKSWGTGGITSIAHVSGGCIVVFGIHRSYLFRPTEWNRSQKKDITHAKTVAFLGSPDTWDYEKPLKNEKGFEHVLDATSMGLWWIKTNFSEEE